MKKFWMMLVIGLVFLGFQVASAAVVFENLGTGAPPATLGVNPVYTLTPFDQAEQAAIPNGTLVTTIPGSPFPGELTTSVPVAKGTTPGTWATWSHGYTGPVFYVGGTTVRLTLPPNTGAFYFYLEPNAFAVFNFTAVTNSGVTSGNVPVNGFGGATGFAFYSTLPQGEAILYIDIAGPAGAGGFALAEFGAARVIWTNMAVAKLYDEVLWIRLCNGATTTCTPWINTGTTATGQPKVTWDPSIQKYIVIAPRGAWVYKTTFSADGTWDGIWRKLDLNNPQGVDIAGGNF
jgi:hypothetical protein